MSRDYIVQMNDFLFAAVTMTWVSNAFITDARLIHTAIATNTDLCRILITITGIDRILFICLRSIPPAKVNQRYMVMVSFEVFYIAVGAFNENIFISL